jgi:hypothetical protein
MADISKCNNTECPFKAKCYRFTAKSNEYWQSYFNYTFVVLNGVFQCDGYIDNQTE